MSNPETQIARGREALMYFHNQALKYGAYDLEFEQLLKLVGGKHPSIFLQGLGFTFENLQESNGFSISGLKKSMEALADAGQGKLPASQTVWFQAMSNQIQNYSFLDAAKFTVTESAKDLAKGAQAAGETVISTLKGLGMVLPFLVVGGLIFYVYRKVK